MGGRGVGLRRRGVGVRILVHTPEDFNNVCVLARTLEVLGVGTCFVYDPHRLIRPCYSKSYGRRLRTVLAGAFFRIRFERVASPFELIREHDGRSIATAPDQSATSLYDCRFEGNDLILFGSEGHGLAARGSSRSLRRAPHDTAAWCHIELQPQRRLGDRPRRVLQADREPERLRNRYRAPRLRMRYTERNEKIRTERC